MAGGITNIGRAVKIVKSSAGFRPKKQSDDLPVRPGMQMNLVLKGRPKKFRTLMGDASGGR